MFTKSVSIFPGNVERYLGNSIFDPSQKDDWNPIFIILKKFLRQKGIDINTYDIATKRPPFRTVYFDLPYFWNIKNLPVWKIIISSRERNILIAHETPIVIPNNYIKIFHLFFKKIYTWNDDLVDNKKYFKLRIPKYNIGYNTPPKKFKNKKFLVLINTNKSAFFPFKVLNRMGRELYSERIKAIEFFEKNIPNKFSLYGRGWNKKKKYNLTERLLGFKKYKTYKGEIKIDGKIKVLSNFKYCICFENLADVKGYITEKIFDCFKARCVPIYWGAENIDRYFPKGCFIDFRDFDLSLEKLLKFLDSVDENKYNQYIKNIEKLLANKKFKDDWFEEGFAKFFLKDILEIKSDKGVSDI